MSVLLVLLLFGVLQVGVYCYARNIVSASAADAARFAAAYASAPALGGPRAEQLIRSALPAGESADIRCVSAPGVDAASGLTVVRVHCTGRLRALFVPLDIPLRLDFTSSALREQRP